MNTLKALHFCPILKDTEFSFYLFIWTNSLISVFRKEYDESLSLQGVEVM